MNESNSIDTELSSEVALHLQKLAKELGSFDELIELINSSLPYPKEEVLPPDNAELETLRDVSKPVSKDEIISFLRSVQSPAEPKAKEKPSPVKPAVLNVFDQAKAKRTKPSHLPPLSRPKAKSFKADAELLRALSAFKKSHRVIRPDDQHRHQILNEDEFHKRTK